VGKGGAEDFEDSTLFFEDGNLPQCVAFRANILIRFHRILRWPVSGLLNSFLPFDMHAFNNLLAYDLHATCFIHEQAQEFTRP